MYRRLHRFLRCLVRLLLTLVLLLPVTLSSRAAQFGPLTPQGIPQLQLIDSDFVRLQIGGTAGLPSLVDMPFLMPSELTGQQLLAARVDVVARRFNGAPSLHLANPISGATLTSVVGDWDFYYFTTRYFESWWARDEALGGYLGSVVVPGTSTTIRGQMTAVPSGISTFDIDQVRLLLYAANPTAPIPLGACRPANIHLVVDNSAGLGTGNVTALRTALGDLMDGIEAVLPDTNWSLTTYRTSALNNSAPIVSTTPWQASPPHASLASMTSTGLSPLANALSAAVSGGKGPDLENRDAIIIIVSAGPPNARLGGNAGTTYKRMYGAAAADAVEVANAARAAGWTTLVAAIGSGRADLSAGFASGVNRGLAGTDVGGPAGDILASSPASVGGDLAALLTAGCDAGIAIEVAGPDLALASEGVTYSYRVTNTGHVPLGSVAVSGDPCGDAARVPGDPDQSELLAPGETWQFTCSYTPSFAPSTPLAHVAAASARHGQTEVAAQGGYTLYPLTLEKDVFLYWSDTNPVQYDRTNASFDIEVRKGMQVLRTVGVTDADAAPTNLWLGEGSYELCEVNVPNGYVAGSGCLSSPDGEERVTDWVFANAIRYDLAIEKSGPTCAAPGQTITYVYTVTNAGPAGVTPAISDGIGGEIVTPIHQGGDANGNGRIDPGEAWSFACDYMVSEAAEGTLVNTAMVVDELLPQLPPGWFAGGDANEENNTASWAVAVVHPAVAITKTPTTQQVLVGDAASFTIAVTNTGDTPLGNVAVSDPLAPDCDRNLGALAAGEVQTYTCSIANVLAPLTNVATVSAESCAGPVSDEASAEVTTALLKLELTSMCWEGDDVHEWRVRNPNPADVDLTWDVYGTSIGGSGTAPTNGDTFFSTVGPEYGSTFSVRLFVDGVLHDSKAANKTWCSPRGTITVDKVVDWNGVTPDDGQTFEICLSGPQGESEVQAIYAPECQIVGYEGGSVTWDNLLPGDYTVAETGPGSGWMVEGSPETLTVPAEGGTVSHTITNTRLLGGLTVVKVVQWNGVTPDTSQTFQVCVTPSVLGASALQRVEGLCHTFGWEGGSHTFQGLVPGDYAVTETDAGAWWTVACGGGTVTVPGDGGSVSTTITNTRKLGGLNVVKVVNWNGVTPDAGQTFTFTITGPSYPSGDSKSVGHNGGTASWTGLIPGQYTVVETNPGGAWTVTPGLSQQITVPAEGGSITATFTNTRIPSPALELVKVASPTSASPADVVAYTLYYTNSGDITLTGVTITDDPDETYVAGIGAISGGGAYDGAEIAWAIGNLAAGASGTVTYQATLKDEAAFAIGQTDVDNVVVIDSNQTGPAQADATVTVSRFLQPQPALTLAKEVGTSNAGPWQESVTVQVGSAVYYRLTVTNSGDAALTDLAIVDPDVDASGCAWPETLAPGASAACVVGPVSALAGEHVNTAMATAIFAQEIDVESNQDSATYTGVQPGLALDKSLNTPSAAPGDVVVYAIAYSNTGSMDLTGVTLVDDPDETYVAGISAISNGGAYDGDEITWSIGSLAAGASGAVTYQATLKGEEDFALGQTAVDNVAVIASNETDPVQDDATVIVTRLLNPEPGLSIVKVGSTTAAQLGDTVAYTITVRNTGNITLTNVTVVDAKLGINQNVGSLAPGASAQVTGSYLVTVADLGGIANTAVADSDQTEPVQDTWNVTVGMAPGLLLVKTVNTPKALVGDLITYTLTVTNIGNVALTDVTIVDPLLGVSHNVGGLAVGQSKAIQVPYTAKDADLGTLHNVATATGKDPAGKDVSDEDDATVIVERKYVQPPTPVPCVRSDVAVVVYGGWNGIPVKAWVGGTEQQTLTTAVDAFGQQQVMWTFYPPANTSWSVSVQPQTPEGKDPARWQYRLLRIESSSQGTVNNNPGSASVSVTRCNQHVLYFQLMDNGITPPSQPQLPVTGGGPEPILAGGLGLFAALSGLGWSMRRRRSE